MEYEVQEPAPIFLFSFSFFLSRSQGAAGPRDNSEVGPDGGARECKRNGDIQANGESGGEGIRGRQARLEETCTHLWHCRDLGAASCSFMGACRMMAGVALT